MKRAILLILDSLGVGASADAEDFGDQGADTFGHIAQYCAERDQPLMLPNLYRLGLAHAALASSAKRYPGIDYQQQPIAAYGYAKERSFGKDTPSGHWEMMGVPVLFQWGHFKSFPEQLLEKLITQSGIKGFLGNCSASGTEIIERLGQEHLTTNKPILYTSADSVLQIAAHEESFGLPQLYDLCEVARTLADDYQIGRVIARPFVGEPGTFKRTANRRDYTTAPDQETLLDKLKADGVNVVAIGKIADIFAHRGITETIKAAGNEALFDATLTALAKAPDRSLLFVNFVDFDSLYGHRRDVLGYAEALRAFDRRLPELLAQLREEDLLLISADHGCDPTWPGSDHTREHVPILAYGAGTEAGFIGCRETFADIGQALAKHFTIEALAQGVAF